MMLLESLDCIFSLTLTTLESLELKTLRFNLNVWTKFRFKVTHCSDFSSSTVLQFISVSSSNCENSSTSSSSSLSGLDRSRSRLHASDRRFALFFFLLLYCVNQMLMIWISSNLDHNMPNYKSFRYIHLMRLLFTVDSSKYILIYRSRKWVGEKKV